MPAGGHASLPACPQLPAFQEASTTMPARSLLPSPLSVLPQGGTRAAPAQLNDRNREEPANYWPDAASCSYAVTLRDRGSGKPMDALGASGGSCKQGDGRDRKFNTLQQPELLQR